MGNKVFIGIGSNAGDRYRNIEKAGEFVGMLPGCKILKVSSVYESEPFGVIEQNNFLNSVICIDFSDTPKELFLQLKNIENKIGRTKTEHWGPREIDLDILLFDNLVYSDEMLTIPHKGILERDFVMVPLTEIEPGIIHPVLKEKISDQILEAKKNIIGIFNSSK